MSKLSRKTTLCNPNALHYAHTADILIYPDGVNIVVRDRDQYPIFGKSFGSETAAKRYLTIHFGRGWKKITEQVHHWTRDDKNLGKILHTVEYKEV